MITMVTEKRLLNYKEVQAQYDGHWVLFDKRGFPPEKDIGYVVAYGDETDEDWNALSDIQSYEYDGKVLLMKGWASKDGDIYNSSILNIV